MKFDFQKAFERQEAIKVRLNELANAIEAGKRDLTEAEQAEKRELMREQQVLDMKIAAARHNDMKREEKVDKAVALREILKGAREDKMAREITFGTEIKTNSGAVNLNIKDVIPTLNEGLGLPASLNIVTGVTGDVLYPYSVNDAEMEELGENAALTDKLLDFAHIKVSSARTGLSIAVSNTAIDNAAFDLMGFVQNKFNLALKKYLALKVYSQAAFTGIKGAFSGLASSGTITLATDNAYEKILEAVAKFTDKGFDAGKVCLVMDATTEAKLKAKPVSTTGVGGFVIENGKCAGYDYVVSHYINTKLKGGSGDDKDDVVATADKSIGIGYFDYLAVQQHGDVRMTIDATSKGVAITNSTAIVLNTAWSITDLSQKLNSKNGAVTQAFARYVIA